MLTALSIKNIVTIDQLETSFKAGLCVLSGETGGGKSILLDALGLTLGARADAGLVREGETTAAVSATYDLSALPRAYGILEENDLATSLDTPLIIRRTLTSDRKSKAFINDMPVTLNLLKRLGEEIVEIHDQFDQFLSPEKHRRALDMYAGTDALLVQVKQAYNSWAALTKELRALREKKDNFETEHAYLTHTINELETLDPQEDEEETLLKKRQILKNQVTIQEALNKAQNYLHGQSPVDGALYSAQKEILRIRDHLPESADAVVSSLDLTIEAFLESSAALEAAMQALETSDESLESVEDRLFTLRQVARKHNTTVEALPEVLISLTSALKNLVEAEDREAAIQVDANKAKANYVALATDLSQARRKASEEILKAFHAELPALKLAHAKLTVDLTALPENDWSAHGMERVELLIATNNSETFQPLIKIASGGERSRIMLALKVILSGEEARHTIIFDEPDTGLGGATASAMGERLMRLSAGKAANEAGRQVFVVTHSPQIAALADQHLHVAKVSEGAEMYTRVVELAHTERREEIARMLSGQEVTDKAREAADSLMLGRRA